MSDPTREIPPGAPSHRFDHGAMACTFELQLWGSEKRYCQQAAWAAFDEVDRLEQLLSRFIPYSDIGRINSAQPGQSVPISPETAECLQVAAEVSTATEGAFDIAFRSRAVWRAANRQPGPVLAFDPNAHAVYTLTPGVDLNLGAIGKGYAVDRAVAVLREWNITAGLASSGQSTVLTFGRPPEGDAWSLKLRDPQCHETTIGTVALDAGALSGSGQLLHGEHIVDPRTGRPVALGHAAWSIAPTAVVADALSTAFMLMSADEIAALCVRMTGVSAILLNTAEAARPPVCIGPHAPVFRAREIE